MTKTILLLAISTLLLIYTSSDTITIGQTNSSWVENITEIEADIDRALKTDRELTELSEFMHNVYEICGVKTKLKDPTGINLCADFIEAETETIRTFLQENQNLTNQILYGVQ